MISQVDFNQIGNAMLDALAERFCSAYHDRKKPAEPCAFCEEQAVWAVQAVCIALSELMKAEDDASPF